MSTASQSKVRADSFINPKQAVGESTTTMSTVYSIACQKGGVGKTSTSIAVSAGLARRGRRVLLIDIDSQANSSKVLLSNYPQLKKEQTLYATIHHKNPLPIQQTNVPGLDLVPSHILLSDTDMVLSTAIDHREARLKTQLDKIKAQYDFVFIDCPPNLNWLTLNAFTASDFVLVVVEPGYFELESTIQIGKTIKEVQDNFNPALQMRGFLFNKSDATLATRTSLKLLRQTFPEHVLNTIIPRATDIKEASFNQRDIFAHSPHSKAADAYQRLIEEIFA